MVKINGVPADKDAFRTYLFLALEQRKKAKAKVMQKGGKNKCK